LPVTYKQIVSIVNWFYNRMYCWVLIFFQLLVLQSWQMASSDCCGSTFVLFKINPKEQCKHYLESTRYYWANACHNYLCGDLTKPTPCCGVGKCNIFCCNCDDGCIKGKVVYKLMGKFGSTIEIIKPEVLLSINENSYF